MARNTYSLPSNVNVLRPSPGAMAAGDVVLKNSAGHVFPLKANYPMIVTDNAAAKTVAPVSGFFSGYPINRPGDIVWDGTAIYQLRYNSGSVGYLTRFDPLALTTTKTDYTVASGYSVGGVCKVNATLGTFAFRPTNSSVSVQAFKLDNVALQGAAATITGVYASNSAGLDVAACKYNGNDAVAVLYQTSSGAYSVAIYTVNASGLVTPAAATYANVIPNNGSSSDARLWASPDGSSLIAFTEQYVSVLAVANGALTLNNRASGIYPFNSYGVPRLATASGVYFVSLSGTGGTTVTVVYVGFDGAFTSTNYTAPQQGTSALGVASRPVSYGGKYYVFTGQQSVGVFVDVFDSNFTWQSRKVVSNNVSNSSFYANVLFAMADDNGVVYVAYLYYDGTNYRCGRVALDLNTNLAVVAADANNPSDSVYAPRDTSNPNLTAPYKAFYCFGNIHYVGGGSVSDRWKMAPLAQSPQGVALTGAAAGSPFLNLQGGGVNSPSSAVAGVSGSYDGSVAGITPAGKVITLLNGKVTVA